jgi:hypothetical protein
VEPVGPQDHPEKNGDVWPVSDVKRYKHLSGKLHSLTLPWEIPTLTKLKTLKGKCTVESRKVERECAPKSAGRMLSVAEEPLEFDDTEEETEDVAPPPRAPLLGRRERGKRINPRRSSWQPR